jgi:adenylate cyclase
MNLQLKSRALIRLIFIITTSLLLSTVIFWNVLGIGWDWNFQILDVYHKQAIQHGYGPKLSSKIVYVTITDDSYDYFGKNVLDRSIMSKINDSLVHYGPKAVAYDIIFARPSNPASDQLFKESLHNLGRVYLPIGLNYTEQVHPFKWEKGAAYERFWTDYLRRPIEKGTPHPFYATKALMQTDEFTEVAFNSGHISVASDPDGIYRHVVLLLKVDSLYFPTLALSMFLNQLKVPFEKIIVDWGREIVIPAISESRLDQDVIIPIDIHGQTFIPYAQTWQHDFEKIAAHTLLQHRDDEDLQGNLEEFFEGKFVFIADTSVGTADMGTTPLEGNVPLVNLHTSLLNGLLTNTFYRQWPLWKTISLICVISILLGLSALPRSAWILYVTGGVIFLGIIWLTWQQFIHFSLFPIVTVEGSFLFVFFGLVIGLQVAISKDQAFIRNAFSKYVPEKVVNELLVHPELLKLGGEERVLSVLFSDLESFTAIAETMSPAELVGLLNEYLSEMTEIILAQGGIIDKYQGDAIMAEFGAPLAFSSHADTAVRAALTMQRRLRELRQAWEKRGLPALRCRIGINTGSMVIGNMGSHQVFDYTVLGDAVNLASRLESANKLYHTYLMISEFTYAYLSPNMFRTRVLDVIKVQGKSRAVKVLEVYGETCEAIDARDLSYYQTYHEAFEAYLSRNFVVAHEQFSVALSLRPADPASRAIITRIDALDPDRLPDDWDGSIALTSK